MTRGIMMKGREISIVWILFNIFTVTTNNKLKCDFDNSFMVNGSCFIFHVAKITWNEAATLCQKDGLHLATIIGKDAANEISQRILAETGHGHQRFWTNSRLLGEELSYVWLFDESLVNPEIWDEDEPSMSSSRTCTYLYVHTSSLRTDNCHNHNGFLCEAEDHAWFGSYICRCKQSKCDNFGHCYSRLKQCEPYWFGKKCQYYNVAYKPLKKFPRLRDENAVTCDSDVDNPLTLLFDEPTPFHWMRIIIKQPESSVEWDELNVTLYLYSRVQHCGTLNVIQFDNVTFDILCVHRPLYVDKVEVSWPKFVILCSLYISKGRNVAIQMPVLTSGVLLENPLAIVDALDSKASYCSTKELGATNQSIEIIFPQPQNIFQILISRHRGMDLYNQMKGMRIEVINPMNQTVYVLTLDETYDTVRTISLLTNTTSSIKAIRLSISEDTSLDASLEVCEVYAFGDCTAPFYGVECDYKCPVSCVHKECHNNGQCSQPCPSNRTGLHCDEVNAKKKLVTSQKTVDIRNRMSGPNILHTVAYIFISFSLLCALIFFILNTVSMIVESSIKDMKDIHAESNDIDYVVKELMIRKSSARKKSSVTETRSQTFLAEILERSREEIPVSSDVTGETRV